MLFKEIPGNRIIKKRLIQSVTNNRISHAQLFLGNKGSAKLPLAIAYSRFLNCEKKSEKDSCGTCSSCIKYNNLSHPDLYLVFPIIKTKKHKLLISDYFVNEWREMIEKNPYSSLNDWIEVFDHENKSGQQGTIYKDQAKSIREKLQLKNYEAQYRTIFIWMPEKMNIEVSNKLLKLLEEPPKGTIFLVVSENTKTLLKTIVSRLQIIKIPSFTREDISWFFSNKKEINKEKLAQLKTLTDSDLGKIIQIINSETNTTEFFEMFSKWMRLAYKKDIQEISEWTDKISKTGRKNQKLFCSYAIKLIRECLMLNITKNRIQTETKEKQFIENFATFINQKNGTSIIKELEETINGINRNGNTKILFFNMSLQIIKLLMIKPKFAKK